MSTPATNATISDLQAAVTSLINAIAALVAAQTPAPVPTTSVLTAADQTTLNDLVSQLQSETASVVAETPAPPAAAAEPAGTTTSGT